MAQPQAHSLQVKTMLKKKHLSSIANHVVDSCSRMVSGEMVRDFEAEWKPEIGDYSKKLVEYSCSMALTFFMCETQDIDIGDHDRDRGSFSFSRWTYDMMLAWDNPTPHSQSHHQQQESLAKEKEDIQDQDDVSLFYSDMMPLLVNHEPSIGEDAFVWMASLVPLVSDVANARFMFETLTATTFHRLHFPAYHMFLKQLHKCIQYLQNQAKPRGVEFADDEYILHVDGTASTQRVIRHIGGTSWPGRLTLTNYALYFEAAGAMTYEDAFKVELAKDTAQTVKPAATGPWGAPLFDKAVVYQSSELSEEMTLEFPEVTSSTRRDLWLALIKEITLMHQFLSKYKLENGQQAWEMHSRTMLGMMRLHAARQMLRISPPEPKRFLIFALFDEVPKGDVVVEELAESLKKGKSGHPCTAASILRKMNISQPIISTKQVDEANKQVQVSLIDNDVSQLQSVVNQAKEEEREVGIAKATVEGLKDEGITNSVIVLVALLRPIGSVLPRLKEIITWKKPITTLVVLVTTLVIVYKEWVGKAIGACLVWLVVKMVQARRKRVHEKCNEMVVDATSDQSTIESIVSAQYGLITVHTVIQLANIAIMKMWSIAISKANKHANMVMAGMCGLAMALALVPFKYFIMSGVLYCFFSTTMTSKEGNHQGNRRLKEWWDSIPIVPVRIQDKDIE